MQQFEVVVQAFANQSFFFFLQQALGPLHFPFDLCIDPTLIS